MVFSLGCGTCLQVIVVVELKSKRTSSYKKLTINETLSACQPGLT